MAKIIVEKDGSRFVVDNGVQLEAFTADGYKIVKNEPQPNQEEVQIVSDKVVAVSATQKRSKKTHS